ncbi:MAG: glycosyltransferase [Coriobacteriia bacterium]
MELYKMGYEVVLREEPARELVEGCDVFATRYWVDGTLWQAFQYAKSLGKFCVLDVDDDVWALHPDNPGYEHYSQPGAGDFAREVARAADMVTVATDYLAELMRPFNKNVLVIRNMLPPEFWPTEAKPVVHEPPVVVGWAGSSSHGPDLRKLCGVVETILEYYPQVRFAFSQTCEIPFTPHERIDIIPPTSVEEYPKMVQSFDVGLAPVLDSRFNRAKSDLKFVEYGICGIPAIASKVVPYEKSIRHGENGLLVNSPADWLKAIKRLIEDEELRSRLGAAARVTAERRTIDRHIGKWIDAFGLDEPVRKPEV